MNAQTKRSIKCALQSRTCVFVEATLMALAALCFGVILLAALKSKPPISIEPSKQRDMQHHMQLRAAILPKERHYEHNNEIRP